MSSTTVSWGTLILIVGLIVGLDSGPVHLPELEPRRLQTSSTRYSQQRTRPQALLINCCPKFDRMMERRRICAADLEKKIREFMASQEVLANQLSSRMDQLNIEIQKTRKAITDKIETKKKVDARKIQTEFDRVCFAYGSAKGEFMTRLLQIQDRLDKLKKNKKSSRNAQALFDDLMKRVKEHSIKRDILSFRNPPEVRDFEVTLARFWSSAEESLKLLEKVLDECEKQGNPHAAAMNANWKSFLEKNRGQRDKCLKRVKDVSQRIQILMKGKPISFKIQSNFRLVQAGLNLLRLDDPLPGKDTEDALKRAVDEMDIAFEDIYRFLQDLEALLDIEEEEFKKPKDQKTPSTPVTPGTPTNPSTPVTPGKPDKPSIPAPVIDRLWEELIKHIIDSVKDVKLH